MRSAVLICAAVLAPAIVFGQTMVEAAVLTGAGSAAATGAGKSTGKSISKIFEKVNGNLTKAAGSASRPDATVAAAAPTKPLPKPAQVDFEGIATGTPREDVIAKAGKPAMAISGSDEEVLCYTTKEGGTVRVRIVEAKVSSIEQTPPKTEPAT